MICLLTTIYFNKFVSISGGKDHLSGYFFSHPPMAAITVTRCDISPNDCPITAPLDVAVEFTTDRPIKEGVWKLRYEVDYTGNRHIIDVAQTAPQPYAAGKTHQVAFQVPRINVDGIKERSLLNMGLLRATLSDGGAHVSDLTMVVQVTKEGADLLRRVLSPVE